MPATSAAFFGPEFWAAVAGAIIGGSVTIANQLLVFRSQEADRKSAARMASHSADEAAKERESVLAFSILMKLTRCYTNIASVASHLHDGMMTSLRERMPFELAVKALSADPPRVEFTLDELVLLKALRSDNVLNLIINLPHVVNMYIDNLAVYRSQRQLLNDLVEDVNIEGGVAETAFSVKEVAKLKIIRNQLYELLVIMYGRSIVDAPATRNLLYDVQQAFLNRLGRERLGFLWDVKRGPDVPDPSLDNKPMGVRRPPRRHGAQRRTSSLS